MTLHDRLSNALETRLQLPSHARMQEYAFKLGLAVPPEEQGVTKAMRAQAALAGKTLDELRRAALKAVEVQYDFSLQELAFHAGELDGPTISELTRRDVGKVFGEDLQGERPLVAMLEKWFPLHDEWEVFLGSSNSLKAQIEQHMVRNRDWSTELLFEKLGALGCSTARFCSLLADALHPLARRGPEQAELADRISILLRRDGYELAIAGDQSTFPVYEVRRIQRGVQGAAKNLIFASKGPKPELGFSNAIDNDIVVLSNADSCLIYERPLGAQGLTWSELVDWYAAGHDLGGATPGRALAERLHQSLDSDAEKTLFATYFKALRNEFGDTLPALIPQVYLHYDPAVVKTLRHRLPLKRQRMDFLLLLPNRQRILVEVDGKHHFADGETASLQRYADMVSADRQLRLAGYEIYRFGANELVGPEAATRIETFFRQLLDHHGVKPSARNL